MGECPIDVHPQLENFNEYFVETWLAVDAKIPVGIWNVYGEDQKRTNNNVEGWNSKFSKLARKHHNNIFEFVDAIRTEQAATELKTAQHDAAVQPARKKKKYIVVNQRLAQFKQEYSNGERSLLRFLHATGHLLKLA